MATDPSVVDCEMDLYLRVLPPSGHPCKGVCKDFDTVNSYKMSMLKPSKGRSNSVNFTLKQVCVHARVSVCACTVDPTIIVR